MTTQCDNFRDFLKTAKKTPQIFCSESNIIATVKKCFPNLSDSLISHISGCKKCQKRMLWNHLVG